MGYGVERKILRRLEEIIALLKKDRCTCNDCDSVTDRFNYIIEDDTEYLPTCDND